MNFKKEGKIVGWDDGSFRFEQEESVPLVGIVMSGGDRVEGVIKREIEVDGLGVTDELIAAINDSKHHEELNLISLSGITFAGFNVVDIRKLASTTGLPVLVVTRKKVDFDAFKEGLRNLPYFQERWSRVKKAGEIHEYGSEKGQLYFQTASIPPDEAERVIEITSDVSNLPEPLRLADMIARALVRGES
ncbi:MAG: DUF99 family protein [Candidatus Bipolaricaulota bacterium]